jgi:hypothetical protein
MEPDEALQLLLGIARIEYEVLSEDEKASAVSLVQVCSVIACGRLLTLGTATWVTGLRMLGACSCAGWRIHLANILQDRSISRDVPETASEYVREAHPDTLHGR